MSKRITGQLIVRDTSTSGTSPAGCGRKLIMVFGVLAVPEDYPLKGEHQYTVLGNVDEAAKAVVLNVLPDYEMPLSDHQRDLDGYRPDQLLTARIWKV